jgi:hypothetical protein
MATRARLCLVAILALCAIGATASGTAQAAEGGPVWLFEGRELAGRAAVKSSGTRLFLITLSVGQNIDCTTVSDTGLIIGGNPGTDTDSLTLSGCKLVNQPACEIRSLAGTTRSPIGTLGPLKLTSKLGYIVGSAKKEAGELFSPESGATFVIVVIEGAPCTLKGMYEIKGTLAAKLLISGAPAKAGEETETGSELLFPSPAITELEIWENASKTFVTAKPELQFLGIKITVSGTKGMETEPRRPFGWNI